MTVELIILAGSIGLALGVLLGRWMVTNQPDVIELAFYRSLTVNRQEGITSIDGNQTARKLHQLFQDSDELRRRRAKEG